MGCLTVFLYDKEHIPHIYPDATLQICFFSPAMQEQPS